MGAKAFGKIMRGMEEAKAYLHGKREKDGIPSSASGDRNPNGAEMNAGEAASELKPRSVARKAAG